MAYGVFEAVKNLKNFEGFLKRKKDNNETGFFHSLNNDDLNIVEDLVGKKNKLKHLKLLVQYFPEIFKEKGESRDDVNWLFPLAKADVSYFDLLKPFIPSEFINVVNRSDNTPVHVAITYREDSKLINYLIDRGASLTQYCHSQDGYDAMLSLVVEGNLESLKHALKKDHSLANHKNRKWNLNLIQTAFVNYNSRYLTDKHIDTLKWLTKEFPDQLKAKNDNGMSVMQLSLEKGVDSRLVDILGGTKMGKFKDFLNL